MRRAEHILVVGAGVIGVHCAYYLAKLGLRVTLLDQQSLGQGCSYGNCGFVCPSHVLPLAAPGAIRHQLPLIFKPNSPLKIRPTLDRRVWSWLWNFRSCCNPTDMLESGRAKHALLEWSHDLYRELHKEESIECEWESRGLLFVYLQPDRFDAFERTASLIRAEFGIAGVGYAGDDLNHLEPSLRQEVHGGWHYPGDTHLRSDKLLAEMRRLLLDMQVDLIENWMVSKMRTDGRRWISATGPQGEIEADAIVLSTGAWAPMLERQFGCKLPILPGKGYSVTIPHPEISPMIPMIFEDHHVAVTPFRDSFRIGSTMEFSGYDASIPPSRIEYLKTSAASYLRSSLSDEHQETWFGWRPMTYDDRPIIGPLPHLKNVVVAAGHGMLGLSMAPATGRLVAEILTDQPPTVPLEPYSIERFG